MKIGLIIGMLFSLFVFGCGTIPHSVSSSSYVKVYVDENLKSTRRYDRLFGYYYQFYDSLNPIGGLPHIASSKKTNYSLDNDTVIKPLNGKFVYNKSRKRYSEAIFENGKLVKNVSFVDGKMEAIEDYSQKYQGQDGSYLTMYYSLDIHGKWSVSSKFYYAVVNGKWEFVNIPVAPVFK